jgi:hypothetical protein
MGYYWSSIFRDVKEYVQDRDNYQRMGKLGQVNEIPLKEKIVIEPFEIWALDFVSPFNPNSNQKVYILVATDYMTKWVEEEALPNSTEEVVIKFMFKLFVRYGLPREVIIDRGHNLQLIELPPPLKIIILRTKLLFHINHRKTGK